LLYSGIDGGYTAWSKWSACSATCGGGVRWHSRTCTNPSPKGKGKTCKEQNLGPAKESQGCNTQKCGEFLVMNCCGNFKKWYCKPPGKGTFI